MDIEDLEKIIGILKANGVTEFELQQEGTQIRLRRETISYVSGAAASIEATRTEVEQAPVGSSNGQSGSAHTVTDAASEAGQVKVESPIVGTFYRKPSPDSEPFVDTGDIVKKGDTLCIIEAMKLMNEIEAPCDGRIERICLNDGQVVEFGEILFIIQT